MVSDWRDLTANLMDSVFIDSSGKKSKDKEQIKEKFDYALQIVRSQYVVSSKIVKSLENTDFYELRISIRSNEYRTILLAVDHDNFIQSKNVLLLNSFLKKNTKQYKAEIKKAENIVKRYMED